MAKFVEECSYLIKGQQRRFGRGRTGEVAYDGYVRSLIFIIFAVLRFVRCHPSTVTLTLSRKEIGIEYGNQSVFAIGDFKCAYLFMVFVDMLYFVKMQVKKSLGDDKNAFQYVFKWKVRFQ